MKYGIHVAFWSVEIAGGLAHGLRAAESAENQRKVDAGRCGVHRGCFLEAIRFHQICCIELIWRVRGIMQKLSSGQQQKQFWLTAQIDACFRWSFWEWRKNFGFHFFEAFLVVETAGAYLEWNLDFNTLNGLLVTWSQRIEILRGGDCRLMACGVKCAFVKTAPMWRMDAFWPWQKMW